VVVAAAFLASPHPDWLPLIALLGGSIVLFFLPFVSTVTARSLIAKVDWSIILFFVGLFLLLAGVRASGLSAAIQGAFTSALGGQAGGLAWLVGLSSLLSNLISNVPAVLLLAEVVPQGSTQLWLALGASSTLAGNAPILGAACNVIALQVASREDVPLPIGSGQTISAPSMSAIMLEEAALEPGERVLEIGTGSGYHAALLAAIVGTKNVVSIERHAGLADRAKANLAATGFGEVAV